MAACWPARWAVCATAPDFELTAEANPGIPDRGLAPAWRDLGINRVSLGVQSLDRTVLDLLGRACDPDTARRALALACRIFRPGVGRLDPGTRARTRTPCWPN